MPTAFFFSIGPTLLPTGCRLEIAGLPSSCCSGVVLLDNDEPTADAKE
jgi:hypothetical protein